MSQSPWDVRRRSLAVYADCAERYNVAQLLPPDIFTQLKSIKIASVAWALPQALLAEFIVLRETYTVFQKKWRQNRNKSP